MSVDLIDRVLYLKKRGNDKPFEEVLRWISENETEPATEFKNDGIKYYWKIISSDKFKEIIDEDLTEWFLIYSKKSEFKALAKKRDGIENLIGQKKEPKISTIWILKSDFDSLKIINNPKLIWTPHRFERPIENINYDFNQLISKLKNPNIKLTEFITDNKSKTHQNRIR
tara:strand:+ start:47 stop:556 length:510 start_codon:yes stop_codon:yes gene_type:complete